VIAGRFCGHVLFMTDVASVFREATIETLAPRESLPLIETLVNAHLGFIWRLFRRLGLPAADADDAAQQVFMIAANKLDKMLPGRERAYLYGIALRVNGHMRRTRRRRREVPIEAAPEHEAPRGTPEADVALRQARDLLDELLARLPEKLRRVLVLVEIEELEVAEAALLEGIPVGTAASRLRLGRERFRALLESHAAHNPFGGRHD
jgi:RNA polymerase sigma-70 factor, ECF subfamily